MRTLLHWCAGGAGAGAGAASRPPPTTGPSRQARQCGSVISNGRVYAAATQAQEGGATRARARARPSH